MKSVTTIFISLILFCAAFAQNRVVVQPVASVSGFRIILADIATVTGPNKAQLDTMEVGRLAAPGTSRYVSRDELFLYKQVPDQIRRSIVVTGESRCSVTMESRKIRIKDIDSDLKNKILNSLSWNRENCKIIFRCDSLDALTTIGKGTFSILLDDLHSNTLKGNVLIPVIIQQGEFKERITIPTYIEVITEVFVATHRMEARQVVTSADFIRKDMDITLLPSVPAISLKQGEQYRIRGAVVAEGIVLMSNRIEKKPTIETGQTISIMVKVGTASLTIRGIARESGVIGDRIAIENINSKKIIHGTVISAGIVRVDQGGGV